MQDLTLHLPDELDAGDPGFDGVADVMEFLAGVPEPEEVLALTPSEGLQERMRVLIDRGQTEGLSSQEDREWAQIEFMERLVRRAKARALARQRTTVG